MWSLQITITVVVLVVHLGSVHGQYVPLFNRSDSEFEKWVNPPNQRVFQKMLLDRMLRSMDLEADPCEDFYQFACGNYKKLVPEVKAVCPLLEVGEQSKQIVDKYLKPEMGFTRTGTERKLRDFLLSCLNSKNNLQSLANFVKSFGSFPALDRRWSDRTFDWMESQFELMKVNLDIFFTVELDTAKRDRTDIGVMSLIITIPTLFEREMDSFDEFEKEVKSMSEGLIPETYLNDMISRVFEFETQMRHIATNSEKKDEENEFYLHELQGRAPGCNLAKLFSLTTGRGYERTETIIVYYPDYVENVCQLVQRTDKRTLADYILMYALIYAIQIRQIDVENLETDCKKEANTYFKPVITGMFARDYLPEDSRLEALSLTRNLQKIGMEMMLWNTSWLDDRSRQRAVKKMEVVTPIIGFHEYMKSEEELWKIYSKVPIDPENYLQNKKHLQALNLLSQMSVVGKDYSATDFDTLEMNPMFLTTARGTIRVQIAALLPPFYHKYTPSFVKHGAFLSVLGHELMHNFDVTGIENDEHGKKSQWISQNRYLTHSFNSECFYTQFQNFKLENTDLHVKGAKTMDENVADNDGLKLAFRLFKKWMTENPDKVWEEEFTFAPLQLTHEQAFFLSFGQIWCDSRSFKSLVWQLDNDPHAPGKFRVVAGVSNSYEFAKAFNCPVNSKMNPSEKCRYFFD